jgi:hypothetical protein
MFKSLLLPTEGRDPVALWIGLSYCLIVLLFYCFIEIKPFILCAFVPLYLCSFKPLLLQLFAPLNLCSFNSLLLFPYVCTTIDYQSKRLLKNRSF